MPRRVKVIIADDTLKFLCEVCECPPIMGNWNIKLISADLKRAMYTAPEKRSVYPETINYMLSELTSILREVEIGEEP